MPERVRTFSGIDRTKFLENLLKIISMILTERNTQSPVNGYRMLPVWKRVDLVHLCTRGKGRYNSDLHVPHKLGSQSI